MTLEIRIIRFFDTKNCFLNENEFENIIFSICKQKHVEMCPTDKEITLEIENTPLTCNKEDLISNSDYFRAMLEGDFVEKNQSRIKLEVKFSLMHYVCNNFYFSFNLR